MLLAIVSSLMTTRRNLVKTKKRYLHKKKLKSSHMHHFDKKAKKPRINFKAKLHVGVDKDTNKPNWAIFESEEKISPMITRSKSAHLLFL